MSTNFIRFLKILKFSESSDSPLRPLKSSKLVCSWKRTNDVLIQGGGRGEGGGYEHQGIFLFQELFMLCDDLCAWLFIFYFLGE